MFVVNAGNLRLEVFFPIKHDTFVTAVAVWLSFIYFILTNCLIQISFHLLLAGTQKTAAFCRGLLQQKVFIWFYCSESDGADLDQSIQISRKGWIQLWWHSEEFFPFRKASPLFPHVSCCDSSRIAVVWLHKCRSRCLARPSQTLKSVIHH